VAVTSAGWCATSARVGGGGWAVVEVSGGRGVSSKGEWLKFPRRSTSIAAAERECRGDMSGLEADASVGQAASK
jgi:hypothetical protein